MNENCWQYEGKCLEEAPSDYYGFVYVITDNKGWKYYGKKAFTHNKKTKLSKKARVGTRARFSRGTVDSKWLSYWGSSKALLEYIATTGTAGFKREILKLCKDRQSLSYWEMVTLVENKVLFNGECWNGNILGKFFKNKIQL